MKALRHFLDFRGVWTELGRSPIPGSGYLRGGGRRSDQGGGRVRERQVGYTIFPTEHDRAGLSYALSGPAEVSIKGVERHHCILR